MRKVYLDGINYAVSLKGLVVIPERLEQAEQAFESELDDSPRLRPKADLLEFPGKEAAFGKLANLTMIVDAVF
jgi:hypothetical protein